MIDQKDLFTEFSAFVLLTTTTNTVGWGNKLVMVFAGLLPSPGFKNHGGQNPTRNYC